MHYNLIYIYKVSNYHYILTYLTMVLIGYLTTQQMLVLELMVSFTCYHCLIMVLTGYLTMVKHH